jgi:hypothetical protein
MTIISQYDCAHADCDRSFIYRSALADHMDRAHVTNLLGPGDVAESRTFDDIQQLVAEAVRETYGSSDANSRTWVWIEALAADWVVFCIDRPNDVNYYRTAYALVGTSVTLGEPTQVARRTIYEHVENPDPLPEKNTAATSNGY